MLDKIPLVKVAVIKAAVQHVNALGLGVEPLLLATHVSQRTLSNPEGLIPLASISQFLEIAARKLESPHLASDIVEHQGIHALGAFGRLVASSLTLRDAIERLAEFERAANNFTAVKLNISGSRAVLERNIHLPPKQEMFQANLFCLQTLVTLVRMAAPVTWVPENVWIVTPASPERLDAFKNFPGSKIHFGSNITAIDLPVDLLAKPIWPDHQLFGTSPPLPSTFGSSIIPDDFVGSLREAMRSLTSAGLTKVELVAKLLGYSRRTFQRRLSTFGLSYFELVDQVLFEESDRLLSNTNMNIRDIATELGYANTPNYVRAFRRWSGVTPAQYRQAINEKL